MQTSPSLRELFETLIELPIGERVAWLDRHCANASLRERVAGLLRADASTEPLFAGSAAGAASAIGDVDRAGVFPPGTRIGPFELVAVLGEGGSSTVFHARREFAGVTQDVALKVLRRGLYSPEGQRQFRRERLALAQLGHPGIARLIEGGVTAEGLAYIALDLVDGLPIVDYARARRLDLRQRLALFLQVCRAVEAAHRALIVHRDLKPSNVLVTAGGQVKLLDFGIAKLLDRDDETRTGVAAFTPAYAAPEQRGGGLVTTATDVYALGILLGELVTGQRLAGASARTPSSQITGTEAPGVLPAPPPVTRRALRGDLDNIVLKAIEIEPERRYASAGALADDVERMLDGRPVAAHPPSRSYRARKFVQRHRGGVALTAATAFALVAALGVTLWQAHVARHEAVRANTMRDFMFTAFAEAEPGAPRDGPPRITDVVTEAINRARADAQMDAGVRTELLSELGAVLRARGRTADARRVAQANYDHARRDFGAGAALTRAAGRELGRCLMLSGEYNGARALVDALLARTPASETDSRSQLLLDSAELATKQHDAGRAVRDGTDGLRLARATGDDDAIAYALSTMGNVQLSASDLRGAARTYEELLARDERRYGSKHLKVATVRAALSRVWRRLGELDAAEREIRAALAIDAAVLPKDDWRHANHLNALTMVLMARRDFTGALDSAREGLRINRVAFGDEHPEVANDLRNIGLLETRLEDYTAALEPLRQTLALSERRRGADSVEAARKRARYGFALAHTGRWDDGENELRRALAALESAAKPDADEIAGTYAELVRVALDRGRPGTALPLLDRLDALAARREAGADLEGRSALLRGATLLALRQPANALRYLRDADARLRAARDADPEDDIEALLLLAQAAQGAGDASGAKAGADAALARLAALRDAPPSLRRLGDEVRRRLSVAQ